LEPTVRSGGHSDPTAVRQVIERFLEAAKKPTLMEAGEECIALNAGNYSLDERGAGLSLQAWDEHRNLVRRIVDVAGEARGRLDLRIEKFGKKFGTLSIVDANRDKGERRELHMSRLEFREQFRRFLRRQWPAYRIAELSTEANLEETLSPMYARALLRSGSSAWAAIGAGSDCLRVDGILSFGLIWLDYLRRREPRLTVHGLILLLPAGTEKSTCLRLRYMNPEIAGYRVFAYTEDGFESALDLRDYGNVDTQLEPLRRKASQAIVRGGGHLLYRQGREFWLETQVKSNLETIDARLLPNPVYEQALTLAGSDRGIIDLLAIDRDGRLVILELKACEDLHLPLQALDYWIHVKWHLERGEFEPAGYFADARVHHNLSPRILLVAPALDIHPSNERVLRYFAPEIEVERIGVGSEFESGVRVMFRMR